MVNPDSIKYESIIKVDDYNSNQQVGLVYNDTFYFYNESFGCGRVPNNDLRDIFKTCIPVKISAKGITINSLAELCEFDIVKDDTSEVDFDFTTITKNELIDFLAENLETEEDRRNIQMMFEEEVARRRG